MTALLFYMLAAVLLGAVAAEVIARIWVRLDNRYFVFAPYTKLLMFPDEETHPQLERRVAFEVNEEGERGSTLARKPNTFRVLVAGGSAAECYFLDQKSAWPAQVESRLTKAPALATLGASHVHVGSIAKSGVHSAGLRLTLERVLPRYDALDLIVLMVGAGDVSRWTILGAPSDGIPQNSVDSCFAQHPELEFGLSLKSTALAEVARRVRPLLFPHVIRRERAGRWVRKARAMRAAATEIRESTPDPSILVANYEQNLAAAISIAKTHSRYVLVVRQPWFEKECFSEAELSLLWNGGVGDIVHDNVTTFYSNEVLFDLLRRIDDSTNRVARQANVDRMELMSLVTASTVNYYDHLHHTPAGAAIVADAVAAKILTMVDSPPREQPVTSIPTRESSR